MAKFAVIAKAFDRHTGYPVGNARKEIIDTKENALFTGCKTILDVKYAYEAFWNELAKDSTEIVFVLRVTPLR